MSSDRARLENSTIKLCGLDLTTLPNLMSAYFSHALVFVDFTVFLATL